MLRWLSYDCQSHEGGLGYRAMAQDDLAANGNKHALKRLKLALNGVNAAHLPPFHPVNDLMEVAALKPFPEPSRLQHANAMAWLYPSNFNYLVNTVFTSSVRRRLHLPLSREGAVCQCMPASTHPYICGTLLDRHGVHASSCAKTGPRSFVSISYGELDHYEGHWVCDETTGDEGFLDEHEDIFWMYDEDQCYWMKYPFQGRSLRKGKGKQGKSKGKGASARRFFRPYPKGGGKGKKSGLSSGSATFGKCCTKKRSKKRRLRMLRC